MMIGIGTPSKKSKIERMVVSNSFERSSKKKVRSVSNAK